MQKRVDIYDTVVRQTWFTLLGRSVEVTQWCKGYNLVPFKHYTAHTPKPGSRHPNSPGQHVRQTRTANASDERVRRARPASASGAQSKLKRTQQARQTSHHQKAALAAPPPKERGA